MKSRSVKIVTLTIAAMAWQALSAFAADDPNFTLGLAAYRQRRYPEATEYFWRSITGGNPEPDPWLYMGHSLYASGKTFEAVEKYKTVASVFAGTPQAALAVGFVKRLDPQNNLKPPSKPEPPGNASAKPSGNTPAKPQSDTLPPPPSETAKVEKPEDTLPPVKTFKDKVDVLPPHKGSGHPPVTKETLATINKAIADLPPRIYQLLDEANAVTHVVPNMVDKWPEARAQKRDDGTTLAGDVGRTYGKEMYVCQQTIDAETNGVLEVQSQKDIKAVFLNECGHVLDDVLKISSMPEMKRAWEQDVDNVSSELRDRFYLYLKPDVGQLETCAELCAAHLGGDGRNTQMLPTNFPRCYYLVKEKLKIPPVKR